MASETWGSRSSHFMIIPHTKRHPNNTKTDHLPIFWVITGLPRPYLNNVVLGPAFLFSSSKTLRRYVMIITTPGSSSGGKSAENTTSIAKQMKKNDSREYVVAVRKIPA